EVAVLDAGGDADLVGIRIIDDIHVGHRRDAEIAQILGPSVDELMRLRASRRSDDITSPHRQRLVPEAVLPLPGDDVEQLIVHMMPMERKALLPRRHDMDGTAKPLQAQQRADAPPLERKLLAVAALGERHFLNVDNDTIGHPTLPSSETEMSFCAST